ncbi:MAG: hypothetical protein ACR2QK_18620, partial [Acidimicrobiales bacterium]
VYTLDESVPDSFLREDRRLLTQIATLRSDAVVVPVAETFDLTPDDLRDKIEIDTIDLSEVLRLDVLDTDPAVALAISAAVIDQYLAIATRPPPSEVGEALDERRAEIVVNLARADSSLLALRQSRLVDPGLATSQESLERQIAFRTDQINRLQAILDDSLVSPITRSRRTRTEDELAEAQDILATLEADLAELRTRRAEIAAESAVESALQRDIERFEAELDTIDVELARRELRPLLAAPVRVLSETTVTPVSARLAQLRGPAVGLLVAIPLAGLLVYRARKRRLWFGQ